MVLMTSFKTIVATNGFNGVIGVCRNVLMDSTNGVNDIIKTIDESFFLNGFYQKLPHILVDFGFLMTYFWV